MRKIRLSLFTLGVLVVVACASDERFRWPCLRWPCALALGPPFHSDPQDRVLELLQSGRFSEAAATAKEHLQTAPLDVDTWFLLGRVEFTQGEHLKHSDRSRAQKAYRRARLAFLEGERIDPQSVGHREQQALGCIYLAEGSYPEAAERFDWAIDTLPDNGLLYRLRAKCHLRRGMLEEAERDLTRAAALDSRNPQPDFATGYELAEVLYRRGRGAEARERLWSLQKSLLPASMANEARKDDARQIRVLYRIFEYALADNSLDDAQKALVKGTELAPKESAFRLELGVLRYRQGELSQAAEILDGLLGDVDGVPRGNRIKALHWRGIVAQRQEDFALARRHLERALELSPRNAPVLRDLGTSLRHLGEHDRAREVLTRFREVLPLETELEDLRKGLVSNPLDLGKRVRMIDVLLELERNHLAVAETAALRELAPRHPAISRFELATKSGGN